MERDVDGAKAAGWSERALYDALTVHSLFAFYNAWVDGAGIEPLGELDAQASGHRLARFGYLPPDVSSPSSPSPSGRPGG